jgi:hypothetical protein
VLITVKLTFFVHNVDIFEYYMLCFAFFIVDDSKFELEDLYEDVNEIPQNIIHSNIPINDEESLSPLTPFPSLKSESSSDLKNLNTWPKSPPGSRQSWTNLLKNLIVRNEPKITHAPKSRNIVCELLKQYLQFFFPYETKTLSQSEIDKKTPRLEDQKTTRIANYTEFINSPELPEIFLQIMIDFLMNQQAVVNAQQLGYEFSSQQPQYEFASNFLRNSQTAITLSREVVNHILSDPSIIEVLKSICQSAEQYPYKPIGFKDLTSFPIPFAFMRRHLFKFLEAAFLGWPTKESMPLPRIIVLWITFLQPWRQFGKNYDATWQPYILANWCVYSTIFSYLLRFMEQLDFLLISRNDIMAIEYAIRFFSNPEFMVLLHDVEHLLMLDKGHDMDKKYMNTSKENSNVEHFDILLENLPDFDLSISKYISLFDKSIVLIAQKIFNHCTDVKEKLAHISGSADSLPTQMLRQKKSDQFDRELYVSRIAEGLLHIFTLNPAHLLEIQQRHRRSEESPSMFKRINSFPHGSGHFINLRQSKYSQISELEPERKPDYRLSEIGREQIRNGKAKCTNLDVKYLGDPLFRPVETMENAFLVRFFVWLSVYLNRKFQCGPYYRALPSEQLPSYVSLLDRIVSRSDFRFNLRFLANYPNILFITVVYIILYIFIKLARLILS